VAYLHSRYLSRRWVDERWLQREVGDGVVVVGNVPALPLVAYECIAEQVFPGAWLNARYLSVRWVDADWLHRDIVAGVGANVTVSNLLAVPLAVFAGSARQTTKVDASTSAVPLATFAAIANAGSHATQANRPGVPLAVFPTTANGGIYQIGDVTITLEVASAFGYSKVVTAQNVPAVALAAIEAIVTTEGDVNVAATLTAVPLAVFPTSAKANTAAIATTRALPLQVFDGSVVTGAAVTVSSVLSVPLAAIQAAVTLSDHINVAATKATVPLASFAATVQATNAIYVNVSATLVSVPIAVLPTAIGFTSVVTGIRAAASMRGIRASARVRATRAVGEN
jgi:hypothetical protein